MPVRRAARRAVSHVVLALGALAIAFPFIWMLATSLRSESEITERPAALLPDSPRWENYAEAWQSAARTSHEQVTFAAYFRNSLIAAAAVTVGVLFSSILAAYAFANMQFRGKRLLFLLFLSTMMIPFEVTLVPNYRTIISLGWENTYLALVVPWTASVFSIFILRQFFMQTPRDYYEAAQLDGCGHWRYLWRIAVPMAAPALVTITIFTFLGSWNAFLWPLLVAGSPEMRVVQVGLALLKGEVSTHFGVLMAASAIVILPVVVLYLILQRRFIEGVAGAGLKG